MVLSGVKDFNRRFSGAPRTVRFFWLLFYVKTIETFLVAWIFLWYPGFNSSFNSSNIYNRRSHMDISFTNISDNYFSYCLCHITIRYITGKCSWHIWFIRWFFCCTWLSTLCCHCFSTTLGSRIKSKIFLSFYKNDFCFGCFLLFLFFRQDLH